MSVMGDTGMVDIDGIVGGGSHIDHVNRIRAGDTEQVLGFKVKAASTVGAFLRGFDEGNVKQLGEVSREASRRVHLHIEDETPLCVWMWMPRLPRCWVRRNKARRRTVMGGWGITPWWRCGPIPVRCSCEPIRGSFPNP